MRHRASSSSLIAIVPGSASRRLATEIARQLDLELTATRADTFPDGETDVAVDPSVQGVDTYIVQSLAPPVNDRLVELLLLLDACRRAGAARLTAVVPYLGYARKDRRTAPGEAVSLRVVADAVEYSGADRAVIVDPHVPQVDSVFSIPLEVESAVPLLAAAVAPSISNDAIVVAPDLGAVHLAERYAIELGLEGIGVVRKTRRSGRDVEISGLVGHLRERPVLLIDDMVSTGSTLEAAATRVAAEWSPPSLAIAVTHGLMVGDAVERLERLSPSVMIVSDSVVPAAAPSVCRTVPLDGLLADTIRRLHQPAVLG
jgi:ribose-phosphate pyrophosphokinase